MDTLTLLATPHLGPSDSETLSMLFSLGVGGAVIWLVLAIQRRRVSMKQMFLAVAYFGLLCWLATGLFTRPNDDWNHKPSDIIGSAIAAALFALIIAGVIILWRRPPNRPAARHSRSSDDEVSD